MGKRIGISSLAVLLAAALLFALLPHLQRSGALDGHDNTAQEWDRVIAYVPLDDRTDNMEDVLYLAEASGYQLLLPPEGSYATKLDGQPLNANGTQHGDRETLFTWVQEMDSAGCNLFLLSLDQLFSGGLVHSRAMSENENLHFADGDMSETEGFDRFILALGNDPNNRVYLFDSVMRLASTVGYGGFGAEEYYALREYGMVARPLLPQESLTLDKVFSCYGLSADGEKAEYALGDDTYRKLLTDGVIRDYLAARERKMRLLDHVMQALQGKAQFRLFVGIDDSSNTCNIQYNELHYINAHIGDAGAVMVGLDSLARLLIARMAVDECGHAVRTAVRCFGGSEDQYSSEFDLYTLAETSDFYMELFGAEPAEPEDAELQILLMTAPAEESRKTEYIGQLLAALAENQSSHVPTVLVEASNNAYGEELENALLTRVSFGSLMGYAGKYDQAVVTGVAFAMGFSRYLHLLYDAPGDASDIAQAKQLANAMALTRYILHSRYELNLYIESCGCDYNNMQPDRRSGELITEKLDELFRLAAAPVEENLIGSALPVSLDPYAEKEIGSLAIGKAVFPWQRTFEISFPVAAALKPSTQEDTHSCTN